MKKYFDILYRCPLFCDIDEKSLSGLLACLNAKKLSFGKKETLISEGDEAKYIGIVLSGSLQISRVDCYGNRSILGLLEPSELFGEAFACAETENIPITVTAEEDSEVMLIDRDRILHTCRNSCSFHQQMIFNLMRDLARKTIVFHEKIDIISKRSTREKLLTYLNIQAKKNGSMSFTVPFDRQGLADFLEVDRSGLSAEISKLRSEGILESRKGYFILKEQRC